MRKDPEPRLYCESRVGVICPPIDVVLVVSDESVVDPVTLRFPEVDRPVKLTPTFTPPYTPKLYVPALVAEFV